jgi:four helix bundle protein
MSLVKHFRELRVYESAREAAGEIFRLSKNFPAEEKYSMTDQIRRSSRAVKALVAEAWGRRRYRASFASKLVEALGEVNEVMSWLDDALDCSYVKPAWHQEMIERYEWIGGMVGRMIDRAADFCPNEPDTDYRVREEPYLAEFYVSGTTGP